jgi:hypothetical protein
VRASPNDGARGDGSGGETFGPTPNAGFRVLYDLDAMNPNRRMLVIGVVLLGILLIAIAVVYFVEPEHSLPSFFPGHASATDAEANHHHTKHGVAALVVALACFAFAWFQTGPKARGASSGA